MIRRNLLAGLCGLAGASVFGAGALRAQTADDISSSQDNSKIDCIVHGTCSVQHAVARL